MWVVDFWSLIVVASVFSSVSSSPLPQCEAALEWAAAGAAKLELLGVQPQLRDASDSTRMIIETASHFSSVMHGIPRT
eukprot:4315562-Pyramimonas_sp.AAC.1